MGAKSQAQPSVRLWRTPSQDMFVRLKVWTFQMNEQVRVVTRSYVIPLGVAGAPSCPPQPFARCEYYSKNRREIARRFWNAAVLSIVRIQA